ncbi:uncharacterized protein VTP21DRAFT_5077 [Calcarisporiella thermophila]|uniref:uncharacterized protein n=1 Tax=Calcarisporiella thermophila TaxID=911321 RepID=UPI003744797B
MAKNSEKKRNAGSTNGRADGRNENSNGRQQQQQNQQQREQQQEGYHFFARLTTLPLISDTLNTLHANAITHQALKTANSIIFPVANQLNSHFKTQLLQVDAVATRSLDQMERRFPIVKRPTRDIFEKAKNAVGMEGWVAGAEGLVEKWIPLPQDEQENNNRRRQQQQQQRQQQGSQENKQGGIIYRALSLPIVATHRVYVSVTHRGKKLAQDVSQEAQQRYRHWLPEGWQKRVDPVVASVDQEWRREGVTYTQRASNIVRVTSEQTAPMMREATDYLRGQMSRWINANGHAPNRPVGVN